MRRRWDFRRNDDGTYTIDLEAFATGEATFDTVPVPADIILVLDVSGSMKDDMHEYTARASQAYTYNNYGNNQYYYKAPDGKYYRVHRDSQYVNSRTRY